MHSSAQRNCRGVDLVSFMVLRDQPLHPLPHIAVRLSFASHAWGSSDGENDTVMAHHRRTRNRSDE